MMMRVIETGRKCSIDNELERNARNNNKFTA